MAEQQLAILRNPHFWVDDRGLVTLRFDATQEGLRALQVLYLQNSMGVNLEGAQQIIDLIQAAGDFVKLDGLPILVEKADGMMHYLRPADV